MKTSRRALVKKAGYTLAGLSLAGERFAFPSAKKKKPAEQETRIDGRVGLSQLSQAGKFLNWSVEEEQYWFFSARDGLSRFERLASLHRKECRFEKIAVSASGLPVYEFRLGHGPKRIAILSGMHGCEPSGPRGLLAFLDALLGVSDPFGAPLHDKHMLDALTLHVFPLLNPGGSERFSRHFPDAWHGTWIPEWTAGNKLKFFAEGNEPNNYFYGTYVKKPPMRFTPDQIARWEETGNVLGSSLTDDGLDMWFDWDDTHGRETTALKEILESVRPVCVADFHNFMYPTEVFAPCIYSKGDLAREERELARAVQSAWRSVKLHFHDREPRPYPKPSGKYYEDAWFNGLGAQTLIIEFNGGMLADDGVEYEPDPTQRALTRRESLASVYFAAKGLAEHHAAPS